MVIHSRFLFLFLSYQFIRWSSPILPVVRGRPSQVCAISLLNLSRRISSMPNPLLVIKLSWWRIGHINNSYSCSIKVIQFLLPEFDHDEWILGSKLFIFSLLEFQVFLGYLFKEASSFHSQGVRRKSLQGFNLVLFQASCSPNHLLSWRLIMVVRQGFHSFSFGSSRFLLEVKDPPSYTLKDTWRPTHVLFFRSSSILHLAFRSADSFSLSFEVVLYHSWFIRFHDSSCQEWDIFNPAILFVQWEIFATHLLFVNEIFFSPLFSSFRRIFSTHQILRSSYLGLDFT